MLSLTLGIALLTLVASGAGVLLALRRGRPSGPRPEPEPGPAGSRLTREQVEEHLERLAAAPAPEKLSPGAMCYRPSRAPKLVEYLCPRCGARTQYSDQSWLARHDLARIRQLAREIPGLGITLDESSLCRKCARPGAQGAHATLVVRTPDGREHRTEGIDADDVRLLQEFASGARVHRGRTDRETPLADHLPRLRALLKVDQWPVSPRPLTRAELDARLRALAESDPPPPGSSSGAMCYEMAAPPDTADYTCPRCGVRTHYSKDAALAAVILDLPGMRRAAEQIVGLRVELDESEFCRGCTPQPSERPQPELRVTLPGGEEHRTRGVSLEDLRILAALAAGAPEPTAEREDPAWLKEHLPRIRELLGLAPKKKAGEDR